MSSLMDNIKTDKSVIPAYASISEAGYYVINAIEEDYNNLMREFALQELGILESTGSEIVYEAELLEAAKEKVTGLVQGAFGKVRGMFDQFLNYLKNSSDELKAKVPDKKLRGAVVADAKNINDRVYAKTYDFKVMEAVKSGSQGTPFWKAVAAVSEGAASVNADNLDSLKAAVAKAAGAESSSLKDIKAATIKSLRGAEMNVDKAKVVKYIGEMWDVVWDYKKQSTECNKVYQGTKKAFDVVAKAAQAGGDDAIQKAKISYYKFASQVLAVLDSAFLIVYKEQINVYKKVVFKVAVETLGKEAKIQKDSAKELKKEAKAEAKAAKNPKSVDGDDDDPDIDSVGESAVEEQDTTVVESTTSQNEEFSLFDFTVEE